VGLFWFILGVVLVLFGIGAFFLVKRWTKQAKLYYKEMADLIAGYDTQREKQRLTIKAEEAESSRSAIKLIGFVLVILGLFTITWDSWTMISPRSVGVVDNMGNADVTLSNGASWVYPWANIRVVDATTKNVNLDADTKNCMTVRLATGQEACVDLTGQWHINQDKDANLIWQKYRGNEDLTDLVQKNVILRDLQRAMNAAFLSYDPLSALITGKASDENSVTLATEALTDIRTTLPQGVVMENLQIGQIHYGAVTQQKLDAFAQSQADTRIAEQNVKTAEQQKLAAQELAKAKADLNDPGVQYQNCLNALSKLAADDQLKNLPNAFTCGSSNVIGQILPAK
jgi:regulator of protease activity HflC (stomatin/prohibitin superfamily)